MKYIDLDLPSKTLWADCNVGAHYSYHYGKYLTFEQAQHFGSLPTEEQIKELLDECTPKVIRQETILGVRFIGKNNNSIFIPFSGYKDFNYRTYCLFENCFCWTCTKKDDLCCSLGYNDENMVDNIDYFDPKFYHSVRLVKNV